jgi:hypothetical protein
MSRQAVLAHDVMAGAGAHKPLTTELTDSMSGVNFRLFLGELISSVLVRTLVCSICFRKLRSPLTWLERPPQPVRVGGIANRRREAFMWRIDQAEIRDKMRLFQKRYGLLPQDSLERDRVGSSVHSRVVK